MLSFFVLWLFGKRNAKPNTTGTFIFFFRKLFEKQSNKAFFRKALSKTETFGCVKIRFRQRESKRTNEKKETEFKRLFKNNPHIHRNSRPILLQTLTTLTSTENTYRCVFANVNNLRWVLGRGKSGSLARLRTRPRISQKLKVSLVRTIPNKGLKTARVNPNLDAACAASAILSGIGNREVA